MTNLVSDLLKRHERGRPLHTLAVTAPERGALTAHLAAAVGRGGLEVLAHAEHCRALVVHAAEELTTQATRLTWSSVLERVGVPVDDVPRYPELYEAVEQALLSFGRPVLVRRGARRFLASFLREGGLPTHIGSLAEHIRPAIAQVGWEALLREEVRAWVVTRLLQRARGPARVLLEGEEGRVALDDLLFEAAVCRELLLDRGGHPEQLRSAAEAELALAHAGIALPWVRRGALLTELLASFALPGVVASPLAALRPPLRLALVQARGDSAELRVRLEPGQLAALASLPEQQSHVTLVAEPCHAPQRLLRRGGGGAFEAVGPPQAFLEWQRRGVRGTTTVSARFLAPGGVPTVLPLEELDWPEGEVLWFDQEGELCNEERLVLQAGERFVVLVLDGTPLSAGGKVRLEPLRLSFAPAEAFAIEVAGEGWVEVGTGEGARRIACSDRRLGVRVEGGRPVTWSHASRIVERLPDLVVEEAAGPVELLVRRYGEPEFVSLRKEITGRLRLSAEPALRDHGGTLEVRLRGKNGQAWGARWQVVPRGLRLLPQAGVLVVEAPGARAVTAVPGTARPRAGGGWDVEVPGDAEAPRLLITLSSGEALSFVVTVSQTVVRLWTDGSARVRAPLDGSAVLTERMLVGDAALEVRAAPRARVLLRTPEGETVAELGIGSRGSATLHLYEVARHASRRGRDRQRIVVEVEGVPGQVAFQAHLPRLTRPTERSTDDAIVLEMGLDAGDLPAAPGLALFAVEHPFGAPRCVPCTLSPSPTEGLYLARVPRPLLAEGSAKQIGFLVDLARSPERPLSGGILLERASAGSAAPSPPLGPVEQALWDGKQREASRALDAMAAGGPEVVGALISSLREGTELRQRYGLDYFFICRVIAQQSPWLLLAAMATMTEAEASAWLGTWFTQVRSMSWFRLRRKDANLLAAQLETTPAHRRMALVELVKELCPMPRSVEHLLLEALFRDEPMVQQMRWAELRASEQTALLREWDLLALSAVPAHLRWLRGGELDDSETDSLEEQLGATLLGGARPRALRALARRRPERNAGADVPVAGQALLGRIRWMGGLEGRVAEEWRGLGQDPLFHRLARMEESALHAAALLTLYREGEMELNVASWGFVDAVEALAPELLDMWLSATTLMKGREVR